MSTTTTKPTKAAALAQVQALIAGTEKHFPNGQFTLGNATYTTATLTQALQSLANALSVLNEAHVRVRDAGLALRSTQTNVGPLIRDYKRFLHATFSTASASLADFGLQALKARKPIDSTKRATATAKLRATRTARGTTSKKQKLTVKGDVTSVEITPVKAAPAPSPPAAPAGSTSPAHAPSVSAK
jgi:hypothetical protein